MSQLQIDLYNILRIAAFGSPLPWKWTSKLSTVWEAYFQTPDHHLYLVRFMISTRYTDVMFGEINYGTYGVPETGITGRTGNPKRALQVFPTVLDIMKDFIQKNKNKPFTDRIQFSAAKGESDGRDTRPKLYSRMIDRFLSEAPEYKRGKSLDTPKRVQFQLDKIKTSRGIPGLTKSLSKD